MKSQQQRDEGNDKDVITTVGDMTEPIPFDLTIEMLKRLPANSLFKFRCVSKQWCSIIRSPSFIDSFMSISLSRPRLSLGYCIHRGNYNPLFYFSSPLHHPQEPNHSSSVVSKHDSRGSPPTYMGLFNSVRGIILISLKHHYFVICNPTTRQVIKLPHQSKSNTCFMFLGYNPSNDQYKILRNMKSQDGSFEHSVCTLETGQQSFFSSWRHVESDMVCHVRGCNVVCINGVVYYGAGTKLSSSFVVVSFDVGSERLRLIQGPNEEAYSPLINYQGKLACFSINKDYNSYILWVLDDVMKQIWSRKTVVPSPSFYDSYWNLELTICGATDAGEIVFVSALLDDDVVQIFYYDFKKNNVRRRVLGVGGIKDYDEFRCPPDHDEFMCSSDHDEFLYYPSYLYRHISISCNHVDNITFF